MPGTVYVVDDDALSRTTIQQLLEAAGHRVITYASARQLLDQLPDENTPGCILLDFRMPNLSGPELQSRLTEIGSTLPIVFLVKGHTFKREAHVECLPLPARYAEHVALLKSSGRQRDAHPGRT